MQKKWSHIDPQLFSSLDEKEVSLKVNDALVKGNAFKRAFTAVGVTCEFCRASGKCKVRLRVCVCVCVRHRSKRTGGRTARTSAVDAATIRR